MILMKKTMQFASFFCFYQVFKFVISTKEKSPQEALQRLDMRCGVTCEDFSLRRNDKIAEINAKKYSLFPM